MTTLPTGVDDAMRNKILERRQVLEARRETINYQIANLKKLFSQPQVRCWYIERNSIVAELKSLPTEEQIQKDAKRVNYSNSTKFDK